MDNLIVAGASMGGQVVRYALTYMEHNKRPHHTKQYIAFDSPHLGANIPIGLQTMAHNVHHYNAYWALQIKDLVKRKLSAKAAKQLLAMYYTNPTPGSGGYDVSGNEDNMRTQFYGNLHSLGNWPKLCEKIAIANGASDGTKIPYINYGDPIMDIRIDFLGVLGKADAWAQKTCGKIKHKTGAGKILQGAACAGAYVVSKGLTNAVPALLLATGNPVAAGALAAALNFSATAYCPDGLPGSIVAKVVPLIPNFSFRTRYNLPSVGNVRAVLDNAAGSGNDGLASVGIVRINRKNQGKNQLIPIVNTPGPFFTFIPTTSALALNTRNTPNFETVDFNGNETDVVDNSSDIRFDWVNFNKTHPTKTVFDRVFFNGSKNEQHVEVTYNGAPTKREFSKITQFMHVARTAQEYWPNGNTPPAPNVRILGNAGTYITHYNFDTLVSEAQFRKSDITNNIQQPVAIGAHTINKNGYLSINEYAPAGMFETKANNSYTSFPNVYYNNNNPFLTSRNWQNQAYQVYGCASIVVNNLGKFLIGDKDSITRYKAKTTVAQYASVTLNLGGTLTINDNSTLTFEAGSNFNYNGGNIVLNGDNARLVINAGANVTLAQGTTFTVIPIVIII